MKRKPLKQRGLLFVISAPSGCGKTTIRKRLISIFPKLINSISVTTRSPRDNEIDGKDYYFISKKEFLKMRKKRRLLEWARNFNHFYGTPRKFVEEALNKGKDVLLVIDVKGAKNVKKKIPKSVQAFLMPPSISALRSRLEKRGTDSIGEIKKRLNIAKLEMAEAERYNYIVVNDSIKNAVERLKIILRSEKRHQE